VDKGSCRLAGSRYALAPERSDYSTSGSGRLSWTSDTS
jgi:hypothetical protein